MLWRIINYLTASVIFLTALPVVIDLILNGTIQSLTLAPFILVESMQVVLLLVVAAPIYSSHSIKELIVCCCCVLLPVVSTGIFGLHLSNHRVGLLVDTGVALTLLAQAMIIWSLVNLSTSFSVLPEARTLRTSGIYKYVRHPIYTNYFIWYLGSSFIIESPIYVIMTLVVALLLIWRAHFEDLKLAELGVKAIKYQQKTGMFFPKWGN